MSWSRTPPVSPLPVTFSSLGFLLALLQAVVGRHKVAYSSLRVRPRGCGQSCRLLPVTDRACRPFVVFTQTGRQTLAINTIPYLKYLATSTLSLAGHRPENIKWLLPIRHIFNVSFSESN